MFNCSINIEYELYNAFIINRGLDIYIINNEKRSKFIRTRNITPLDVLYASKEAY